MPENLLEQRIRRKSLISKVSSAEEAAKLIDSGMALGVVSGDQSAYPKTLLTSLANRLVKEHLNIALFTAGPVPHEVEGLLTMPGVRGRKYGQLADRELREAVNAGKVPFTEARTGLLPYQVRDGRYGKIDIAILAAVSITEEGYIVPSTSLLDGPSYVAFADKVILEIDTQVPLELEGIHDVYFVELPPNRKPIPITHAGDRIGTPYIPVNPDKIVSIVPASVPDKPRRAFPVDKRSEAVADHLLEFLKNEVSHGRLTPSLLPLQLGIGSIPTAFTAELVRSPFTDLQIFSGSIGDGILDLIDAGKIKSVSTSALYFSQNGFKRFYEALDRYKHYTVLRPVEVADCPELISRLGVISINGALEVDLYGNVNSTHVCGSMSIGGIGGSCDFIWNAYLSVILLPSIAANGAISTIVPMVTHVDHPEHAVDVIVTEQGLADLRGLTPVEKARMIIANCAHPSYRSLLNEYLEESIKKTKGHEPHLLTKAFSFHIRHAKRGSMKARLTRNAKSRSTLQGKVNGRNI